MDIDLWNLPFIWKRSLDNALEEMSVMAIRTSRFHGVTTVNRENDNSSRWARSRAKNIHKKFERAKEASCMCCGML